MSEPWTYGAEHELADWDRSVPLPPGYGIDYKDVTIVNSNGTAVLAGKKTPFGGEINTPPSNLLGQGYLLRHFLNLPWPRGHEPTINHRSNLHIHIRVPGLRDNLPMLKQVAKFNAAWLPKVLPLIEPIPYPQLSDFSDGPEAKGWTAEKQLEGARKRWRRRRVSHHTIITRERLAEQWRAKNLEEFFAAECPKSIKDGKPLWHLAPRHAVNLRHLREDTDTIEFRHWPGTLDPAQVDSCVLWCHEYLLIALRIHGKYTTPLELFEDNNWNFPTFPDYVHWREMRYQETKKK